jgi:Fe2+ or Zn2+ uptake regulation protein
VVDSVFSLEGILSVLRAQGLRVTDGRRLILQVLFDADHPLSLQEIQDLAAARGAGIDYATVFRMVTLLETLRFVHKVHLQKPCSYYELTDPSRHYDHVVCTQCGKVVVLDLPCPVGESERVIAERYGFTGLSHSLQFFGSCPDCTSAAAIPSPPTPQPQPA